MVDLPAHATVSTIGGFIDGVAERISPEEIGVFAFDRLGFLPDVLRSGISSIWHWDSL